MIVIIYLSRGNPVNCDQKLFVRHYIKLCDIAVGEKMPQLFYKLFVLISRELLTEWYEITQVLIHCIFRTVRKTVNGPHIFDASKPVNKY